MLVVKPENVGLQIVEEFDLTYASRPRFSPVRCLKKSVQFLFSQVGLCGLVVLYALVGGLVFQHLEQANEIHECQTRSEKYAKHENETLEQLWAIATNVKYREDAVTAFRSQLTDFRVFLNRQGGGGGPSECSHIKSKGDWTFPDAMLFSVTVFTTIGYGNVAPRTFWGRLVCICYAMLGIPLMLLCLGNLATVLGNAFRYVYSQMLCCGCCLPRRPSSKGSTRRRPGIKAGISGTENSMTPEQWMKDYEKYQMRTDNQSLQTAYQSEKDLKAGDLEKEMDKHQTEEERKEVEIKTAKPLMEKNLESHGYKGKKVVSDSESNIPPEQRKDGKTDGKGTGERTDGRGTGTETEGWTDGRTDGHGLGGKANWKCVDADVEVKFDSDEEKVGVPLTISLGIIAGYLLFGSVLYGFWELEWSALESTYYCFVTISTIGFGDLVPGSAGFQTEGDGWRMVSASLYMLIGMALLSMCFNLMQDEIAEKCRRLGQIIGLIDK